MKALTREYRVILASPGGRRGRGGVASFVSYLADALPTRLPALRVDVLDTYGPGAFWVMPFSYVAALLKIVGARLLGRVDLLHIHMGCGGSAVRKPVMAMIAISMGLPTIMHLHASDFDEYFRALPLWRRKLLIRVLMRCVRVVVIGNHWRDFVIKELGLDPARVVLIHNGAPASACPAKRTSSTAPKLVMLGELGVRKGTPELVTALAMDCVRQRNWTAIFAGNGSVDRFRSELASKGLSDRVHLTGWQSAAQVHELLERADILLLPSHQEGLPMSILEAMAHGVAVIATPVGAIPDAITDGETGLLVSPGNAPALACAIVLLLDDPVLRQRLAANARARFDLMFTIDHTADSVAALYSELGVV